MNAIGLNKHRFVVPSGLSMESQLRWAGKMSPEPETLAWIAGMRDGEVFYDIGASCGRFAFEAIMRGLRVYAFDADRAMYDEMRMTRDAQPMTSPAHRIKLYHLALFNSKEKGKVAPGRGDRTFKAVPSGDVMAMPLDEVVVATSDFPTHIKIDVDGNEWDILKGGHKTLTDHRLRSVLIEVDPGIPEHSGIPAFMQGHGFRYDILQVDRNKIVGGKYDGLANYIFYR